MDSAQKDTRDMIDVFVEALVGADRVIVETKNALGEMDAHILHAPEILRSWNTRPASEVRAEAHAAAIELAISHFEVDDLDSERTADHCKYAQKELRTLHTDASREYLAERDERIKREAREEALREAAAACQTAWAEMQEANPTRHDALPYIQDGCEACQDAITALIEKDKDDD